MNVIVVDDFYQNPMAIRQLALTAEYRDVTQLNYPGFQSVRAFTTQAVVDKFAKLLDRPLNVDLSSTTFGKFRIMLRETGSRLKVHLDGACDWTGVLYLNPPQTCQGGTAFYRHRETGLDGPVAGAQLERFGFSTWEDLENRIINKDTLNPNAWEETMYVGMKFNRLVLFKGNELFHCHTHSFGHFREDGRMTQNFFFDEA